jgi:putative tricarboxylic transport membrane protein
MKMKRDELIGCGIVFLFGGITAVLSLQMPIGTFRMAGAGLFPLCLGILLMILALFFLLNLLFGKRATPTISEPAAATPANAKQVLLFLVITAVATLCLGFLGYPAFCFLLMLLLLRILGIRRPALLLGLSLLTAAGAYLLFVWFLKIPLPKGLIGL